MFSSCLKSNLNFYLEKQQQDRSLNFAYLHRLEWILDLNSIYFLRFFTKAISQSLSTPICFQIFPCLKNSNFVHRIRFFSLSSTLLVQNILLWPGHRSRYIRHTGCVPTIPKNVKFIYSVLKTCFLTQVSLVAGKK